MKRKDTVIFSLAFLKEVKKLEIMKMVDNMFLQFISICTCLVNSFVGFGCTL